MKIIKAGWKQGQKAAWVILLGGLLVALLYSIVMRLSSPQFVVFDMKGEITAFQANLVNSTLNASQQQELANSFMHLMNKDLTDYASAHHVVVLVKGAVVSGSLEDITPKIQARLMNQISDQVLAMQGGS